MTLFAFDIINVLLQGYQERNAEAYKNLRHFETHLEQPYPVLSNLLDLQKQVRLDPTAGSILVVAD